MATEIERAWAAGFFEGEGSIMIAARKSVSEHGMLVCEVAQVDPHPLEWLNLHWPARIYRIAGTGNARASYRWMIIANKAAGFLKDIKPFVVRPKVLTKVLTAIEFQEQKTDKHINRTQEYKDRQLWYVQTMRKMNERGQGDLTEVELAALSTRV